MNILSQLTTTTKPLFEAISNFQIQASALIEHGSSTFRVHNQSIHAANAANCERWLANKHNHVVNQVIPNFHPSVHCKKYVPEKNEGVKELKLACEDS